MRSCTVCGGNGPCRICDIDKTKKESSVISVIVAGIVFPAFMAGSIFVFGLVLKAAWILFCLGWKVVD